jgi:hypothetical protein
LRWREGGGDAWPGGTILTPWDSIRSAPEHVGPVTSSTWALP